MGGRKNISFNPACVGQDLKRQLTCISQTSICILSAHKNKFQQHICDDYYRSFRNAVKKYDELR